ncbi:MAG: hypothetical protein IKP22_05440 [Clostridia bacterium]|nr:hypothetical protein [Clostridia bacterium]
MSKFLWCEDSKSGYQFWSALFRKLYPDVTVETKGSNTGLRKAASKIAADGNVYYIVMDTAVDNPDVLRETRRLKAVIDGKDNVHVFKVHSFEFALLSFELLEQWVFSEEDELKEKRQSLLQARAAFLQQNASGADAAGLQAFKAAFEGYESKNSEQIAAKLLYEITRNTGFETDKSQVGDCFINTCCEWAERQRNDMCGLDSQRISAGEKAKLLADRSALKAAFEGVGL